MGGFGSGNWFQRQGKKTTVEESLCLSMTDFRGRIHPYAAGTLTWTWARGDKSGIGYYVDWGDGPMLTLHYRWAESEDVLMPVRIQVTPTQFGGRRQWFTCPLTVDGVACNRRVRKLYLPPGSKFFGCRTCHGLTYRSCQEAHQTERQLAGFHRMKSWLAAQKR